MIDFIVSDFGARASAIKRKEWPPAMTVEQFNDASIAEFLRLFNRDGGLTIEAVGHGDGRVRQRYDGSSLRPGGTISGATMMRLADFAMHVARLASIGWVPLAVTINLNINFLRAPAQRDLLGELRLIKLGKRLGVGDIGPVGGRGETGGTRHSDLLNPTQGMNLVRGTIMPFS